MPTITVNVNINVDGTGGQRTITIEVDPEPVYMGNNDTVEWKIQTDGWTFIKDKHGQSDGIIIKNHLGKMQDKKGKPGNKDHQWQRVGAMPDPGEIYRYTIRVTNETDPSVAVTQENLMTLSWDPTMHNP